MWNIWRDKDSSAWNDIDNVSKEEIFSVCSTVRMRRYSTKCLSNDLKKEKRKRERKTKKEKERKKEEHLFFP